MRVAVLGAGAGGASAIVELSRSGHDVQWWNRSAATLEPLRVAGGIYHEGVLDEGFVSVEMITDNLRDSLCDADVALVCLPTMVHGKLATALAHMDWTGPVVLNPGHTGSALEFSTIFRMAGKAVPPVAEFSTLTYVARKTAPDRVSTTGCARNVHVACLPGGEAALDVACALYDCANPAKDILVTALANVNMVLHPPGSILGASWIEATGGDFTFYVEGLGDGVGRVMGGLDAERCAVAKAFGHELPCLFNEMQMIGTIEANVERSIGLVNAVRGGRANAKIKAPESFNHRYYLEDFWYGLLPFSEIARIGGVETPIADALMSLVKILTGKKIQGRNAAAMGIDGLSRNELLKRIG
ncbi:MAG: NAD/NADP octopine/nopaline dehydrogenase [Alphaproteobacteria bacterium]|nr:MAG: NAD/NADP octopine/nopaline dehydrogenase [Alphaproteobacteria bacterium]